MSTVTDVNPRKVVYIDLLTSWWPDPTIDVRQAADAGFNVINLAFYLTTGPVDAVNAWAVVATQEQRQATLDYIHSKGAVLIMSAGGATENPYSEMSGIQYGTQVATFAHQYQFDGVDFDLENFGPGLTYGSLDSQAIINWLVDCTNASRDILGASKYISHAPQAPYFGPIGDPNTWVGILGGYTAVYDRVKTSINFFNIQFYNQGSDCYNTYNNLFKVSCPGLPKTAVNEIAATNIPMNALVVGKPMLPDDATTGYTDPVTLSNWFVQAKNELNWEAGVMTWQWHGLATSQAWLNNIYPSPGPVVIEPSYEELLGHKCHNKC